ncbi:hypothetical protein Tco_0989474 [Tanacetum coccineum]|uniref:Uncharacterized protein n=1 Tax=Tanacetum coccineum TaxID=301880 RepID=A0ABQ5EUV9_9ASTR
MTTVDRAERCLWIHFLCVNVVLLAMLVNVRSSAKSGERLDKASSVAPKRMAIRDAVLQVDVVTGTFLLNNHYASVLFNSGSDRSFVDTRFSSMLDIDPVKIDTSYELHCTVYLASLSMREVVGAIARAVEERIYSSEFITVGSTGVVREKERWVFSNVTKKSMESLKIILELLKKERLYAKFSKCDFWLDSVQFLGHVIDRNGVHG